MEKEYQNIYTFKIYKFNKDIDQLLTTNIAERNLGKSLPRIESEDWIQVQTLVEVIFFAISSLVF